MISAFASVHGDFVWYVFVYMWKELILLREYGVLDDDVRD
jgi:hypothetical protein